MDRSKRRKVGGTIILDLINKLRENYPGKFKVSYKNPVTGYKDHGSKDFHALGFWCGMG
jgi:hypothetical protein